MYRMILALVSLALTLPVLAAPGKLLREETLRSDTGSDAPVLARLVRGSAVNTLERRGGWLRVSTLQGEGWVRLLSVRGDAVELAPLAELKAELMPESRRIASRVVAVAGFRGGEEEEKIEAAGRAALEKLENFRLTGTPDTALAAHGGLAANQVDAACGQIAAPAVANMAAPGGVRLSLMSAWLLNRMTSEDEAKIGRALAVRLLSAIPAVNDPGLQRYINQVGRRMLAAGVGQTDLPGLFAVLDSEEVFAYSAPGGYVFITHGLYLLLQDESQLAALLAREIAHLADKRLLLDLRRYAPSTGRPRDESEFLRQLLGDGLHTLIRPYSIESEYQADRTATLLSAHAGYDPYALVAFLQNLGRLPENDARLALLLRTQPRTDSRLERLAQTVEDCLATLPLDKVPTKPLYQTN